MDSELIKIRDEKAPKYDGSTCSSTRVNAWEKGFDSCYSHLESQLTEKDEYIEGQKHTIGMMSGLIMNRDSEISKLEADLNIATDALKSIYADGSYKDISSDIAKETLEKLGAKSE